MMRKDSYALCENQVVLSVLGLICFWRRQNG